MQKKWSHIDPHLIDPLNEKEVSLKVNSLNTISTIVRHIFERVTNIGNRRFYVYYHSLMFNILFNIVFNMFLYYLFII